MDATARKPLPDERELVLDFQVHTTDGNQGYFFHLDNPEARALLTRGARRHVAPSP